MIWGRFLFFLVFAMSFSVSAEILSIPENCLKQEIAPCLVKSNQSQTLKSKSNLFSLVVQQESIVKVLQFSSPFKLQLLQGKMIVQSEVQKAIQFTLNNVPFKSQSIFAKFGEEGRLQVYDSKNFIFSEYEQGVAQGQETVIHKAEFLAKLDMIRFLSEFFGDKKSLFSYLKSIELNWKNELKSQTNDQTMALQRSVASIEKAEEQSKAEAKKEAEELKKVRRQFFYRTFYR